jgi:hypothetical protein
MDVKHKQEQFKIQMGLFEREINLTNFNFGIMNKDAGDSTEFTSYVLDGYIGILPYKSSDVNVG